MNLSTENILLVGSILLLISVLAGRTSYRFGVPTLLFFLGIGMLAGSEGVGGIYFDDPALAQFIGVVSLNFILFSGGLDTSWRQIKPVLAQGITLSTLGVLITAGTLGIFVWQCTNFSLYEGLLLGAIVSSTDAAAVFSILRSKNLSLRDRIRPTLELESGSNDPMAYVLTLAMLNLVVQPEASLWGILPFFLQQMLFGALAGLLFGRLGKFLINEVALGFESLYPVLAIALMGITFSATDQIGGNGFLAVYICGVYLGNQALIQKKNILQMFDGLAWLMQIILFLTLGLLVFPSRIVPFIGTGILIAGFLIFIARPLSVWLTLSVFRMRHRRRAYISWVGLRGAVPIVFATYPLIAGIEKADTIFNIVFFITLTSVVLQGTSLSIVAKWLGVALPETQQPPHSHDLFLSDRVKSSIAELTVMPQSPAVKQRIIDLGVPESTIIAMINRQNHFITPNGRTRLQAGDVLIVLSETEAGIQEVAACL